MITATSTAAVILFLVLTAVFMAPLVLKEIVRRRQERIEAREAELLGREP